MEISVHEHEAPETHDRRYLAGPQPGGRFQSEAKIVAYREQIKLFFDVSGPNRSIILSFVPEDTGIVADAIEAILDGAREHRFFVHDRNRRPHIRKEAYIFLRHGDLIAAENLPSRALERPETLAALTWPTATFLLADLRRLGQGWLLEDLPEGTWPDPELPSAQFTRQPAAASSFTETLLAPRRSDDRRA